MRLKILLSILIFVVFAGAIFLYLEKSSFSQNPSKIQSPKPKENKRDILIKKFGIKIEKIGVLAPVIKDVSGTEKSVYNKALEKGVAHFKGTSLPNEGSNIFIFGHSSKILGKGPYAEIFAELGELEKGDEIIIYYQGKEIKYTVFEKDIVEKNDLSVLEPTKKEQLTLMTCWPIGSAAKRLIIKSRIATK